MKQISVLDQSTIDKIAAGEVVERPSSVVKELMENAIDAGASAVTVEIREGGISLIRITDNGQGIAKDQVRLAFLRHATSKITTVDDLLTIATLGFRGEALSSIAAVSRVELITKPHEELTGVRYLIEGGMEKGMEEIGAPDGSTFLVRDLFYNTPARAKFLKSAVTEAGYVAAFLEQLALSHPDISFKYIQNGQVKLHTSGNGNRKEVIYQVYGREIARELIDISYENDEERIRIDGFIAKPDVSRGNRSFENYYVNGRYVKNRMVMKAIEDAYHTFMMQHRYPFTSINITLSGSDVDINVHPGKMEVRFAHQEALYKVLYRTIVGALHTRELIPEVTVDDGGRAVGQEVVLPEAAARPPVRRPDQSAPCQYPHRDAARLSGERGQAVRETHDADAYGEKERAAAKTVDREPRFPEPFETRRLKNAPRQPAEGSVPSYEQETLPKQFLAQETRHLHKIVGQVFDTYWIVQMEDKLYIIDQHAAHERVLYERIVKQMRGREITSQLLCPPLIISLNLEEQEKMEKFMDVFSRLGFEIESFGGREYSVRAVPQNLYGYTGREFFLEILDRMGEIPADALMETVSDRMATMACKAAIKGNHSYSLAEAQALIDELLALDNPYNCPHGRPTIIAMTKYELEKKFKRIV